MRLIFRYLWTFTHSHLYNDWCFVVRLVHIGHLTSSPSSSYWGSMNMTIEALRCTLNVPRPKNKFQQLVQFQKISNTNLMLHYNKVKRSETWVACKFNLTAFSSQSTRRQWAPSIATLPRRLLLTYWSFLEYNNFFNCSAVYSTVCGTEWGEILSCFSLSDDIS